MKTWKVRDKKRTGSKFEKSWAVSWNPHGYFIWIGFVKIFRFYLWTGPPYRECCGAGSNGRHVCDVSGVVIILEILLVLIPPSGPNPWHQCLYKKLLWRVFLRSSYEDRALKKGCYKGLIWWAFTKRFKALFSIKTVLASRSSFFWSPCP